MPYTTEAVYAISALAFLALILWALLSMSAEPESEPALPDRSALLEAERTRQHSAAANIAAAEGLPETMRAPLRDLADVMALDVHEGRRTPASAMQYMTSTCRKWTRTMRDAGAA